jgi:broad specificity phosphatase PhoE
MKDRRPLRSAVKLALCLALTVGLFPVTVSAEDTPTAPTTVILVRHAEKARMPKEDPPLNMAGQARAGRLLRLLERGDVTALYATEFQRTQQTLSPLAQKFGLEVQKVPAGDTTAMAQAALQHPGGVVVIAAHSNTLGAIIEALGGPAIDPIPESEYENLFVVSVFDGAATLLRLSF